MFWDVGDEIVEQTALAKQGWDAALDRAGPELTVHSETFAGGAQDRRRRRGERLQEQETVATLRIVDFERARAHCETRIPVITEAGFGGPFFGISRDDPRRGKRAVADDLMPSLLHVRGLNANDRADLAAGDGDFHIAQLARPSVRADPIGITKT